MLTNEQIKVIHESGIKTRKDVQARINKELKRVCKLKDCDNSLAFERKDRIFCSRGHSVQYKYNVKRANKLKKQRYNEKHGIKRKALKRDIKQR
jgi:hypothetical protein